MSRTHTLMSTSLFMKHIIRVFIIIFSVGSFAGIDVGKFEISFFEKIDDDHFLIKLKTIDEDEFGKFKDCKEIEVFGDYHFFYWLFNTSGIVSKANHKRALTFLEEALKDKQPVLFGEIGTGMKVSNEACCFESKGLSIIEDEADIVVVSLFNDF